MAFSHTVGGTTFTEASFEGNAYADESTGFPKAMEKMVEHVANAYRGTSTTSNAVGTGSKTWTVTNSNSQIPAFAVGMPVRVARTSAPTTTYMQGEVTAFTAATGSTTVNVSSSLGSGTHTDWTITIGGHQTTASASPLGIADGGTGAATAAAARTALDTLEDVFTTRGDLLRAGASGAEERVALGAAGTVVRSDGTDAVWGSSGLASVQVFTSNGTWTKPTDVTNVLVTLVGGGGGGGGVSAEASDRAAGGGGAGGAALEFIDVTGTASETATVGAAGAAGAIAGNGGTGGTTSLGSLCSATGGAGGTAAGSGITGGGAGGAGSGGDANLVGAAGSPGTISLATTNCAGGGGGSSYLGGGGSGAIHNANGNAGNNYGGGGQGAGGLSGDATGRTGGAGAPGLIIVWEYK